jgi:hypothetical protein
MFNDGGTSMAGDSRRQQRTELNTHLRTCSSAARRTTHFPSGTQPTKGTTMKKLRLATCIALFLTLTSATVAEETWWRIVNGPGAGNVLIGSGLTITNGFDGFASGFIAAGHYSDCECTFADGHYHGSLFLESDPRPNACGWGCVVKMPCSSGQANDWLDDEIVQIGMTAPGLASKLSGILDDMKTANASGCYSVLEGLADAFEEEIYSYFGIFGESSAFDPIFRALCEYVGWAEYEMDLDYDYIPEMKPNTVKILARNGSGALSTLFDVGPKINARLGSVVSLEGYGAGINVYKWDYKWKGAELGENPSGCSLSFLDNHLTATSQKQTQVRITVWGMLPDERRVKDTTIINFHRLNF